MTYHLTYLEAVVTGLIQGVTELFPVSSLGHNVLIPALIGGTWAKNLSVSAPHSPYLAFIVGLHVATAIAMIAYFWRDWLRIVRGFFSSLRHRSVKTADQRLAWMIILATIPVGIVGALLQKVFVSVFAKPELAALFLAINGVILLVSERMRRSREPVAAAVPATGAPTAPQYAPGYPQQPPPPGYSQQQQPWQQQYQGPDPRSGPGDGYSRPQGGRHAAGGRGPERPAPSGPPPGWSVPGSPAAGAPASGQPTVAQPAVGGVDPAIAADRRLSTIGYLRAVFIGASQILALFPGISRDGIVTVAGMGRGLRREDAVRFSFLLSAPVILAAGVLKVKDLTGPMSAGMHGPILVGAIISGVGAYLSIRFLTKYFSEDKSLSPFGIYCLVGGIGSLVYLLVK